jgi:hypothetical protein
VADGTYKIITDIDDSFSLQVIGLNMQGGQYRKIFERSVDEVCKAAYNETFKPYYDDLQAAQNIQIPWKTCPYPKGEYELRNYYVQDYGSLIPPYMPGGEKWMVTVRYIKDDEIHGGFDFYVILRSEQSLLQG